MTDKEEREGVVDDCRTVFVIYDRHVQLTDDFVQNTNRRGVQVGRYSRIVQKLLDTSWTKARGIVCAVVRSVANWESEAQVADAAKGC